MTKVTYFEDASEYSQDVKDLLVMADEEFVPPLSGREGTTQQESLDEAINNAIGDYHQQCMEQSFILSLDGDSVVGFLSFRQGYDQDVLGEYTPSNYVSTIIVHPEHRRKGYAREMYHELLSDIPEEARYPYVTTRTWSTNHSHLNLLKDLGFKNIKTIPDDRGNGLDTVYYGIAQSEYKE